MKETTSQYEKLLAALVVSGVDFAVVGGVAVILNGYPRYTQDADIIVQPSPENLQRMLACLEKWGEGWARELKPEDFQVEAGAVRVTEDFDLDIFTRMMDKTLDDFRPSLRYEEMKGVRIPYISPADLIFLKQNSWRDKDKSDVQAMREIMAREARKSLS